MAGGWHGMWNRSVHLHDLVIALQPCLRAARTMNARPPRIAGRSAALPYSRGGFRLPPRPVFVMENQTVNALRDEYIRAGEREEQESSRASVRSGERMQEAMLFVAPSIVRNATCRRRTDEFRACGPYLILTTTLPFARPCARYSSDSFACSNGNTLSITGWIRSDSSSLPISAS